MSGVKVILTKGIKKNMKTFTTTALIINGISKEKHLSVKFDIGGAQGLIIDNYHLGISVGVRISEDVVVMTDLASKLALIAKVDEKFSYYNVIDLYRKVTTKLEGCLNIGIKELL